MTGYSRDRLEHAFRRANVRSSRRMDAALGSTAITAYELEAERLCDRLSDMLIDVYTAELTTVLVEAWRDCAFKGGVAVCKEYIDDDAMLIPWTASRPLP